MSTQRNTITGAADNSRKIAIGLAILGFVARLVLAIVLGLNKAPEAGSDQEGYDVYAWNLAQGRGYRGPSPDVADPDHLTANCVPGTPMVWAGLYAVFGHRYDVIRIMHCIAGGITVLVVFEIGRRSYGDRVGLAAAAVTAVFPTSLLFTIDLMTEALGTLWFLVFMLVCLIFAERRTWGSALLAGLVLGVAMLTRPNYIFMFPLVVVWGAWQFRGHWSTILRVVTIPVVAVAVIIPWTVRNYRVFHEFIPLSTLGGSGLLQGNNDIVVTDPKYFGYCVWDSAIPEYREALQTAGNEVERDRRARQFAIQWIKDHPEKWSFLFRAKLQRALTPFLAPNTPKLYRLGMLLAWGPVLLLFGLAFIPTLVASLRRREPRWLLHLAILQFLLTSVIFFGYARYRQPIEPLCIILAVRAVEFLVQYLTASRSRRLSDVVSAA